MTLKFQRFEDVSFMAAYRYSSSAVDSIHLLAKEQGNREIREESLALMMVASLSAEAEVATLRR